MSTLISLNKYFVSLVKPELIEKQPVVRLNLGLFTKSFYNRLVRYWYQQLSTTKKNLILLGTLGFISGVYIILPTLFPPKKMFTKRPDKHTTGLINLRNDCFANSSLQAYLALPGMTKYLNEFIGTYQAMQNLLPNSVEERIEKDVAKRGIPLHIALAKIMKKLQDTQMTSRTISVWTFLHTLEAIFHAKISKSQHDAHELTQLINETLENENLRVNKILKEGRKEIGEKHNAIVTEQLNALEIPEFPLSGLTVTRMDCLQCKYTSKPSFVPFLMLTLNTPQKNSTELQTLLDENQNETIEGYQCLKCRIVHIVQNEVHMSRKDISEKEKEYLDEIRQLNENPHLSINEDLNEELENYIKSYKVGGLDISKCNSSVLRKNQILKPPKVFGIHLSRSSFDGVNVTRNACRIAFKDQLTLSIGKDYADKLNQFQYNERDMEDSSHKQRVLTTDVDDMEDEEVQREDIDEKGEEDDEETTSSSATETETETDGEIPTGGEIDDTSSLTSRESVDTESIVTSTTAKVDSTATREDLIFSNQSSEYNSISKNQSDNLKLHFKSFKFNKNDVYKYKLRALIRHQGSHSQGHYECYKRKPLYVKDSSGTIYKLSPEIDEAAISENQNGDLSGSSQDQQQSYAKDDEEEEKSSGQFRRRFSTIMGGKRPSIVQAHQEDSKILEIIHSGSQTPAELLIDTSQQDYFSNFKDPFKKSYSVDTKEQDHTKVKMKKIPSLIKNPYWRISDAQVSEVPRGSVLFENTTVYMLYYERVDREQIRK